MKPRVLFVMGDWPNPSETFLMREMSALARRGLDFEILATGRNLRGYLPDEFAELSERVWFLPHVISPESTVAETVALLTRPLEYLTLALQLFADNGFISGVPMRLPASVWVTRKIALGGFTRIHAQFASLPGAVGRVIAEWLKLPFSFSCHARDLYVAAGLERLVTDADFVVTCTDYNCEFLAETFPSLSGKFHRVYHGIEPGKTAVPKERDEVPLILAVGRLVEKKGFANLISACKILTRRNVRYRCEIVGAGPLRRELADFISDLQPLAVELTGWCGPETVRRKMRRSACLVAPSIIARDGDRDGIPNVILEAMTSGTPVIATHVSGIPEVVHDGRTGLLVEPNDTTGLAEAITRLVEDPTLGKRLASNARKLTARQFDPQRNVQSLMKLLTGTP